MLFHSYTFAYFFILTATLHRLAPRAVKRWVLLAASYTFYSWWNPRYSLLILVSTLIDYVAAKGIAKATTGRSRRLFLLASLTSNLGILGLFKYYNFFNGTLRDLLSLHLPLSHLLLPVGVSFYTFQSMSYTIDVYRKKSNLARDFVDFALFVSFFPQLVAGPIVRAVEFLPQLASPRERTPESVRSGMKLFCLGLFKKMVIADNLATFVDAVHQRPTAYSSGDLWICAYAFAFQIYFDFSAYSEMAIGLARILGFGLPENFRRPYLARNPSEFWRRWHISLSTWLRDYLYIPLGGSRSGTVKNLRNLMITMVLGGLWHGANWTFVVWGFLHGSFLIVHRVYRNILASHPRLAARMASPGLIPLSILLTFHAWAVSMVIFRAASIADAGALLRGMFLGGGLLSITGQTTLVLCIVLYLAQVSQEYWDFLEGFDRLPLLARSAVIVAGLYAMILWTPVKLVPFIYFQF